MIRTATWGALGLALTIALSFAAWAGAFASHQNAAEQAVVASWTANRYYVDQEGLKVELRVEVQGDRPVTLENWALSSAAFSVDGHALGSRKGKKELALEPGQVVETTLNLEPALQALEAWDRRALRLTYHGVEGTEAQDVLFFEIAEKGIEFLELPEKQLTDYQVILRTNRGDMWLEFWPDVAPNHVRNFLDLSYTGFYDQSQFHRVIPGFMIQGGRSKGGLKAPRNVDAEFNDRKHTPGVLSMARLDGQPNSASSEFFVMHARYPSLDGKYSGFGKIIEGLDVVDQIVRSGDKTWLQLNRNDPRGHTPTTPQIIERALVVKKVTPPKAKQD